MESIKKHLLPGIRAAKANVVPALMLQAAAVVIGLCYWLVPPVTEFFMAVAELKQRGGYLYSMVSTAFWGGLLPLVLVRWQKGSRREPLSRLPFFVLYWAFVGCMVDAFYRFQAFLFGNGTDVKTLAAKVSFDMLVYTPFIAIPLAISAYAWKDGGFRWAPVRALWRRGFFLERVLPMCPANWAVWIPPVTILYAMPLSLQLPIQNLVQCLWVLFLMILTRQPEPGRRPEGDSPSTPAPAAA